MPKTMSLNVRVAGVLQEHLAQTIGDGGSYDNASEYVRDLIRKDMIQSERVAFEAKQAALCQAFALPKRAYRKVSMDQIIERHLAKRR